MFLVGTAADFVVRQGSLQQICCCKLNAETTAGVEVDKGCAIPSHV